jgi:monoterpene epsilon-lactone hydrolase
MPSAETQRALQIWRDTASTLGTKRFIWEMRAGFEAIWSGFSRPPEDCNYEPVAPGNVSGEWIVPPGATKDGVILYLHGGGYVICSPNTHRELAAQLAKATGCRALVLEYRLAPEFPFPAAVEDSVNAYRWLLAQGFKADQITMAGDSAGGGLVVATLVAIRYFGLPQPAAAASLSPWTDLACTGGTLETKAQEDPIVSRPLLEQLAQMYLAGADPKAPLASPLYADLRGLAPLLIQVGTAETLLDDAKRLAEKIRSQGGKVELQEWEGMPHVWHFFVSFLPEAKDALAYVGSFLRERMAAG